MAKKRHFKLVFKKTNPMTKAAILAATCLSVVALVALYSSIDRVNDQYRELRVHAIALESGKEKLQEQIDDLGSLESALRIAREELGLAFPDSMIYTPGN